MKITVVGCGYVGLSNGLLLAQNNNVVLLDIDSKKADALNRNESPVFDEEINNFFCNKKLNFIATIEKYETNYRIWILMDLMGRKTKIKTYPEDLQLSS